MDRLINVKISGSHLAKDCNVAGVRGEANVNHLRITFDESWDGYAKKVTFWDARGKNPVERTLTLDLLEDITKNIRVYLCPIPGEPMVEAGMMTFIIDGWAEGKRPRSMSAELEVEPAPVADNADQPVDPTPTQAEQLQAQLDAIKDDVKTAAVGAQYAEQAIQYAAEAKTSAEAAEEARQAAENSENLSADNANRAEQALSMMGTNAEEAAASAAAAKAAQAKAEEAQASATQSASAAATSEANAANIAAGVQESVDAAAHSATEAAQSVQGIETYAAEAKASAVAAKTSETNAASSAANAKSSEINAESSATSAASAKRDAESAVGRAETAQYAAENANTVAQSAKTAAESAKLSAETARAAAQTAKSAAETAQSKAEAARDAAQAAQNKAEQAQSEAEQAKATAVSNASAAAASADAAENSESNATASAIAAASSASEAGKSEQSAASSATSASSSASIAERAASDAVTAKEGLEEAKSSASASASAAAKSASDAATSEAAAEAARAAAEAARDEAQQVAGGNFASPGYVDGQISAHNTDTDSHNDIRQRTETAIQLANSAYDHADEKPEIYRCYFDETSYEEVEEAYQNGNIIMLSHNYELWPLVYAEEYSQYRFSIVSDGKLKIATVDIFEGWSESDADVGGDGVPVDHAVNDTTYGVGSIAQYGHVKLSDAMDSYDGSTGGIAATPLAVKTAYDKAKEALAAAEALEALLSRARIGTVTLRASAWTGSGSLYSQVVTISGVTENSQVDLTPSVEQLVVFYEKDLTFVTENEDGVVTVYAIGQKPTNDYTIQVTITEVNV